VHVAAGASLLMMSIWGRWLDSGRTVNVAVVGAGFIGRGAIHRLGHTPGMRPCLIINRSVENGVFAFKAAGVEPDTVVVSDDAADLAEAIASGRPALSTSIDSLEVLDDVELVVEATGALGHGAGVVLGAIESGKHVVSMNAELDATIGTLLHHSARKAGCIYTISDGDQPGVMLRQMEFVTALGFEITAAINCKRVLDIHQNPDVSRQYSNRDNTSLTMTTAFGDGTKMQIENAVVANITGLVPDRRGMHGVETTLASAAKDIMAVLSRRGVVDYTLGGDFGGGIGVIGSADDAEMVQPYMRYSKMGDGPDYFFFRPYHLLHFELPLTIAEVILDGRGLGAPVDQPVSEVIAVAKKDLSAGEALDGIGGFACYGLIDTMSGAEGMLPVGLAEHAIMKRPVSQDQPVKLEDVEINEDAEIVRHRRSQEDLIASSGRR
jgi:predicted homoserine dehydrogenase-like protein